MFLRASARGLVLLGRLAPKKGEKGLEIPKMCAGRVLEKQARCCFCVRAAWFQLRKGWAREKISLFPSQGGKSDAQALGELLELGGGALRKDVRPGGGQQPSC